MENEPLFTNNSNSRNRGLGILQLILISIIFIILIVIVTFISLDRNQRKNENNCSSLNESFPELRPFIETNNETNDKPMIILKNAKIWNGKGLVYENGEISFKNGKIIEVGDKIDRRDPDAQEIDVQGRYVTPGLVDMHSHLGVYSFPDDAFGTQDGNEATNPTFPQLRSMDGLNPNDPAIEIIRSGGVTTSLVLPGSANVMGGEATYVKLKGKTQRDMFIPNPPRSVKMACGENPKRVYGNKGQTPASRMGNVWLMRSKFFDAYLLKQQQEQWDCLNKKGLATTPRPENISLQILVDILKGDVFLQIHCYKVEDLESAMRTAKEFSFNISAFHHAVEAWKIPDILKEKDIGVAIFADLFGFKMEGYNGSVNAGKIFEQAGVKFAYKTDHPVILGAKLIYEAQKAHYYGVTEQQAFSAVTSVPANLIGLGNRIGSLEPGYEADIVVWTRHPLDIGARAQQLYIDGELFLNENEPLNADPIFTPSSSLVANSSACLPVDIPKMAIVGANVYSFDESDTVLSGATVLVENGVITCVSSTPGVCVHDDSYFTYTVNGATLIPGTINVNSIVGQTAVDQEATSSSGTFGGEEVRATDGVFLNMFSNKPSLLTAANIGGVTTIITRPIATGLIRGIGGSFYTFGVDVTKEILSENASFEIAFGEKGKAGTYTSVASQMAYLRKQFTTPPSGSIWASVINKSVPLVSETNQLDYIAHLLKLQRDFNFDLVIVGGGESHLLASTLSAQNVSVILTPFHVLEFNNWNSVQNSMKILEDAGVNVGLTDYEPSYLRNIRWEAGRFTTYGVSRNTALKSFTKNIAKAYKLYDNGLGQIKIGTNANFVVYNGDPLNFQGHPILTVIKQRAFCNPTPY